MGRIDQLRSALGSIADGKSDAQLLSMAASATGQSPNQVADYFGYDPGDGGTFSKRIGASIDNYQAGLYGLGESLADAVGANGVRDYMRGGRESNEYQANVALERARNMGAIDDPSQVRSLSDAGSLVAGYGIQALPYLGEMAAGGMAGRALSTGLRAAVEAGRATQGALDARSAIAGAAATYPSSVGSILQTQRQSNPNGDTDLTSAAVGGIPFAALNGVGGVGGHMAEGSLARWSGDLLNNTGGITGGAMRMGATMGREAAIQGAIGTGQEFINQAAGRSAVDPDASPFDARALSSYGSAAAGGAIMGGAFGAIGGWRRSDPIGTGTNTDALNPQMDAAANGSTPQYPVAIRPDYGVANVPQGDPYYGSPRGQARYDMSQLALPAPDATGRPSDAYTPGTLAVTPSGTVAPPQMLSGLQRDMFDGPDTYGHPAQPEAPGVRAIPDTQTGDLFQQNPTSMVRTAFNPMEAPHGDPRQTAGVVAANIRSQITQITGMRPDAFAVKLSLDMSQMAGDPASMKLHLADQEAKLKKSMDALDRKVSGGSNMLSPEEYNQQRSVIENKQLQLAAAQEIAARHHTDMVNAMADEGRARAKPGERVGVEEAPKDTSIAQQVEHNNLTREEADSEAQRNSFDAALKDHDARVEAMQAAREKQARLNMLDELLDNKNLTDARKGFSQMLKDSGYPEAKLTADEEQRIANFERVRDGFKNGERSEPAKRDTGDWRRERDAEIEPEEHKDGTKTEHDGQEAAPAREEETRTEDHQDLTYEHEPFTDKVPEDDLKEIKAALDIYNSPMREGDEGSLHKKVAHETRVMDAAETLHDYAHSKMWGEPTRKYARYILDTEVDPKDIDAAIGRRSKFSQGSETAPEHQLSEQELKRAVDLVTGALPDAPEIGIADHARDVDRTAPASTTPSGGVVRGKIYLFRSGISDFDSAVRTIFHELFHYGLAAVLPQKKYIERMLQLQASDAKVREYAGRWRVSNDGVESKSKMSSQEWHAHSVEEALADIAEEIRAGDGLGSKYKGFVRSMVNWLANVASDMGMKDFGRQIRQLSFTDAERLVNESVQAALQGKADIDGVRGRQTDRAAWRTDRAAADKAEPTEGPAGAPQSYWDKLKTTPMGYMVRDIVGGWRKSPRMLGWLTLDQLKDRFPQMERATAAIDRQLKMGAMAGRLMDAPRHIQNQWGALMREDRSQASKLNSLLIEATRSHMWVDSGAPITDPRNKHLDFKDPEQLKTATRLKGLWDGMDKRGQDLYRSITNELELQRARRQDTALRALAHAYKDILAPVASEDELVKLAQSGKIDQLTAKAMVDVADPAARNDLVRFLHEVNERYSPHATVLGPYFPLLREGEHVVSVRSRDFKDLESKVAAARDAVDAAHENKAGLEGDKLESAIADARESLRGAREELSAAKSREKDYSVEFYKSRSQAEDRVESLRKERPDDEVKYDLRHQFDANVDAMPAGMMERLTTAMSKDMPAADRKQIEAAVRQFLVQALPDRSALKAEAKRMNVAGVKPEDAMRSFAMSSHRSAWITTRLEHGAELARQITEAKASGDIDERIVGNEIAKRYAQNLQWSPSNALIDAAANFSSLMHLGFSPGYYMQQLLQPYLVSMPVLAGRHGFARSGSELLRASKDVLEGLKKTSAENWHNREAQLDLSHLGNAERALIEELTDGGRIDLTVRQAMGIGDSSSSNPALRTLQGAANLSAWPAQQLEVVNRVATALAAYRMETSRGASPEAARAYADKIVTQTHVLYGSENAPRYMDTKMLGGMGKLLFQFKRYQQAMVFLWGKTLTDAVRTGGWNEHAKSLVYLTAVNAAIAGAAGLPVAAPLGLLLSGVSKVLDSDDDKKDYGQLIYKAVKDSLGETAAQVLHKGLPALANIDASNLGSGNILAPVYRIPSGSTGPEVMGGWALQLFGAAGGTLSNLVDAAMVYKQNPVSAVEKLMPSGLKTLTEALARPVYGLEDRHGRPLANADEFGTWDGLSKVLGLGESMKVSDMYDQRSAFLDSAYAMKDARAQLLQDAVEARAKGDGAQDVMEKIQGFNERHPEDRITQQNILAAVKSQRDQQRQMRGGVRVTKQNIGIARQYGIVD